MAMLLASSASGQNSKQPATSDAVKAENETRYLAFPSFSYYRLDSEVAALVEQRVESS